MEHKIEKKLVETFNKFSIMPVYVGTDIFGTVLCVTKRGVMKSRVFGEAISELNNILSAFELDTILFMDGAL